VLDVGCGPGFLCESIAEIVGRDGAVAGMDISGDFIALCKRRNPPAWLSYAVGEATKIDRPDASFDVVACIQVAEFVPDVDRVLSEAFRVLRPGGRAVFVATDWDALVWHSERPDRMALVMKSWEPHCAHPRLPRSLSSRLAAAGFRVDGATVFPILNLDWHDDTYSKGLAGLVRGFVGRKGDLSPDELEDWYAEFARLGETGRYFFSSNRYIFRASRPAG
jgi:SAM-dependent methyltransferase